MSNKKATTKKRIFAGAAGLMMIKLYALGWMAAGNPDILISPVSPAPAYAQGAPATVVEPGENQSIDTGAAEKKKISPKRRIRRGGLDIEIIRDVERRSKALEKREKELNRREEKLNLLQVDLDKQISELKAMQAKIEESITLRNDLEKGAIDKLAKTYASMPPESAATLIGQIDKSIAIRMLNVMKERAAGRILAAAPPDLATELSEGLVKKR